MNFTDGFTPNGSVILNITNANPGVVTTNTPNGYKQGLYVRLLIPTNLGMQQVNNQVYLITVLTAQSFSINVDTTNYDLFNIAGPTQQVAQVIPVGEVALTLINAVVNNDNIIPEL